MTSAQNGKRTRVSGSEAKTVRAKQLMRGSRRQERRGGKLRRAERELGEGKKCVWFGGWRGGGGGGGVVVVELFAAH